MGLPAGSPALGASNRIRALLFVQTGAGLVQWLDIFLLFSLPVFGWGASAGQVAAIALAFGLSSLLLGPFVGALADRLDVRRILLLSMAARTILNLLMFLAPGLDWFVVLVLFKGVANTFYWSAASVATQRVVPLAQRARYFGTLSVLDQVTKLATPVLVAALAATFGGLQYGLLLAAVIAGATWLGLYRGLGRLDMIGQAGARHAQSGPGAGVRAFAALPAALQSSVLAMLVAALALALYDPHLPSLLKSLGMAESAFSSLVFATAAGAITGGLAVRHALARCSPGALIRLGLGCFAGAVAMAAFWIGRAGQATPMPVLGVLWFVNGLGYEVALIGAALNLQNLCPSHLIGRIGSAARSLQMAAVLGGPALGAQLVANAGAFAPLRAAAVLLLALVAGLAAFSVAAMVRPKY